MWEVAKALKDVGCEGAYGRGVKTGLRWEVTNRRDGDLWPEEGWGYE